MEQLSNFPFINSQIPSETLIAIQFSTFIQYGFWIIAIGGTEKCKNWQPLIGGT